MGLIEKARSERSLRRVTGLPGCYGGEECSRKIYGDQMRQFVQHCGASRGVSFTRLKEYKTRPLHTNTLKERPTKGPKTGAWLICSRGQCGWRRKEEAAPTTPQAAESLTCPMIGQPRCASGVHAEHRESTH